MKKKYSAIPLILWSAILASYIWCVQYIYSGGSLGEIIYSSENNRYYIFFDLLIFFIYPLYLYIFKSLEKNKLFKCIPMFIANLNCLVIVFYSPALLLNYTSILILCFSTIILAGDLQKKDSHGNNIFIDISSLFVAFATIFSFLIVFYNSAAPYWIVSSILTILLLFLISYRAKSIRYINENINTVLIMLAILFFEIITFSFFWPVQSILIKSLLIWLIYYILEGATIAYFNGKKINKDMIKYLYIFVLVSILLFAYLIFKGAIK